MRIHIVLCLVTASVLTANSAPRLIELPATATYSNAASRFQFPPKIADFVREKINQFDNDGRDIGVGYNDLVEGVAVTIYIYPMAQQAPNDNLEGHFGTCKSDILNVHKDAQSIADRSERVLAGGQKRDARYACYTYSQVFAKKLQPVRSELYLFSHGRWFVKIRATYPVGRQALSESALKTLINDFAWPYRL
ncbi:MAG TPA: hypothetical protein VFZ59_02325 [Verrucomicrobiae bacterium]|nr:hypothetical protein [Verrucomicrobiae bacterium]